MASTTFGRVIKAVSNGAGTQFMSNLSLAEEEIILDIDGTIPTQPVLQHIGISAWPGELIPNKADLTLEPEITVPILGLLLVFSFLLEFHIVA